VQAARLLLILWTLTATGCVWRTERAEHYFGPTLLRTVSACDAGAAVVQARHLGVVGEAGRQWGVAIGVADRVAVVPRVGTPAGDACGHWAGIGGPASTTPGRWTLSPLYARWDKPAEPALVRRVLWGAQLAAGTELTALSLGVVSRTQLVPIGDGVYAVTFDSTRPMETRFTVWPYVPGQRVPLDEIMKEE
jgi:hypothetical protein